MKLTDRRRAWLARLLIGPTDRHSNVGYWCMHAGWTEWNYVDANGTPIDFEEAKQRFGIEHVWEHIHAVGERITAEGRAVLEEAAMAAEPDQKRIDATWSVLDEVRDEVMRAVVKFPTFNSHHEGYAVLLEEVDELWDEVKANNHARARAEAVQVAAMAVRFITDLEG